MPKKSLKVRSEHWFQAATQGNLETLERWERTGVLKHRFELDKVSSGPGPGRPTFFRLRDKQGHSALTAALKAYRGEYALRLLELAPSPRELLARSHAALPLLARIKDPCVPMDRLASVLVRHGCDINETRRGSHTPLGVAAQHSNVRALKAFLGLGAEVSPAGVESALTAAIGSQDPESVACILAAGADPNRLDPAQDTTPLMEAAAHWSGDQIDEDEQAPARQIIRMLVLSGADPDHVPPAQTHVDLRSILPIRVSARNAFEADCARALAEKMAMQIGTGSEGHTLRVRF